MHGALWSHKGTLVAEMFQEKILMERWKPSWLKEVERLYSVFEMLASEALCKKILINTNGSKQGFSPLQSHSQHLLH